MEKFTGTQNTKKYTSDLPRSSRFLGRSNTSDHGRSSLVEVEDLIDALF